MSITRLQGPRIGFGGTGTITTTWLSTPTQGSLLLALVYDNSAVMSISGWLTAKSVVYNGTGDIATLFYKVAGAGEGSVTTIVGGTNTTMTIEEWSGVSLLDQTASVPTTGVGVLTRSSGTTPLTTVGTELLIACFAMGASVTTSSETYTNSFVEETNTETDFLFLARRIVASPGTYGTTCSWSTTRVCGGLIATFKAASTPGATSYLLQETGGAGRILQEDGISGFITEASDEGLGEQFTHWLAPPSSAPFNLLMESGDRLGLEDGSGAVGGETPGGGVPVTLLRPAARTPSGVLLEAGDGRLLTEDGNVLTAEATPDIPGEQFRHWLGAPNSQPFNLLLETESRSARLVRASSQYLTITDAPNYGATYTMMCWFRPSAVNVTQTIMAVQRDANNFDWLRIDSSGGLLLRVQIAAGSLDTGIFNVQVDEWVWIAAVRSSATSMQIYAGKFPESVAAIDINNSQDVSGRGAATQVQIGNVISGANIFGGDLAAPRIFTRALSLAELKLEAAQATALSPASLWADWWLGDKDDQTDHSGNGRSLTLTNGPIITGTSPPYTIKQTNRLLLEDGTGALAGETPGGGSPVVMIPRIRSATPLMRIVKIG